MPAFAFSLLLLGLLLSACSDHPATVESAGDDREALRVRTGLASYYGRAFEGQETASGEIFDKEEMVAAHPSYPTGTVARVTNLENGRQVQVRIIDRGPTAEHQADGVIIDLSQGAAQRLGFLKEGRTRVRVEVLSWGEGN